MAQMARSDQADQRRTQEASLEEKLRNEQKNMEESSKQEGKKSKFRVSRFMLLAAQRDAFNE